jgi:hypothetical protein
MKYYATFASGFQEVVKEILSKTLPQSKLVKILDGAVIFECPNFPNLNSVQTIIKSLISKSNN